MQEITIPFKFQDRDYDPGLISCPQCDYWLPPSKIKLKNSNGFADLMTAITDHNEEGYWKNSDIIFALAESIAKQYSNYLTDPSFYQKLLGQLPHPVVESFMAKLVDSFPLELVGELRRRFSWYALCAPGLLGSLCRVVRVVFPRLSPSDAEWFTGGAVELGMQRFFLQDVWPLVEVASPEVLLMVRQTGQSFISGWTCWFQNLLPDQLRNPFLLLCNVLLREGSADRVLNETPFLEMVCLTLERLEMLSSVDSGVLTQTVYAILDWTGGCTCLHNLFRRLAVYGNFRVKFVTLHYAARVARLMEEVTEFAGLACELMEEEECREDAVAILAAVEVCSPS